ncbi:MAG: MFS transporter, partial [Deltaproteobacteria bacterium]|nr:MFS transporter [Deltaproteobacteria bacterium]
MGFRRLLVADAVSSLGDWLTYVGISVLAIGQGQHGLALAVVLVAHTLPRVVCAPFAGALADRVDRRAMLVVASVARGVAALAMVAAATAGELWVVQGLHLGRMALGAFTDAAARAALPRVVPASGLARANALLGISWSATFVLGIAAGGAVTAWWGVAIAFAADAVT